MHKYLRAIGFSKHIRHLDINNLLAKTFENPDEVQVMKLGTDSMTCMTKYFGEDFGLRIFGEYDEDCHFRIEYYFPFSGTSPDDTILTGTVEKHVDKDAFSVLCEDFGMGIALIFYMQNPADYIDFVHKYRKDAMRLKSPIHLGGLSTEGKILLPIYKTKEDTLKLQKYASQRAALLESARKGDEDAMENLTLYDIELFNEINQRICTEDLYSIVDSTFMPSGIECDSYSILGEIVSFREIQNTETKEYLYELLLSCNDLSFQVTINQEDLLGEPAIGRRFKGEIWMQGYINFKDFFEELY